MRGRGRVGDAAVLDGSRVSADPILEPSGLPPGGPGLASRSSGQIRGGSAIRAGCIFVLCLLVFASVGQAGSPVLNVENVLMIQMSLDDPPRACLWGMDHDQTVEALETFQQKGYLDCFIDACA